MSLEVKRLLKWLFWAFAGFILLGFSGVAYLHFNQELMVFQPFNHPGKTPDQFGMKYEEVWLKTPDGEKLHGWYLPMAGSRGVILYCHGNAGNISHREKALTGLAKLGLDIFIFDYRGYGQSTGSPTELGTYQDVERAWQYLVEERGLDPSRIVIWGRSLGGAIGAYLASKVMAGAVVLESTFTSIPDLAAEIYPVPDKSWVTVQYPTLDRIKGIRMPHLHAHSPGDDLVAGHHGDQIFQASGSLKKKFIAMTGTHRTGHLTQERYLPKIDEFLREALPPLGTSSTADSSL